MTADEFRATAIDWLKVEFFTGLAFGVVVILLLAALVVTLMWRGR